MKKIILVVIIVITACICCACQNSDVTTTTDTTTNDVTSSVPISVGMTYDDIQALDLAVFCTENCAFLKTEDGRSVVGAFGGTPTQPEMPLTVEKVTVFPAKTVTHKDFESLKDGMTLLDVVEHVGVPIADGAFGVVAYAFACTDGTEYIVSFFGEQINVRKVE